MMWIAAAKARQRGGQNNLRCWHWQVSSTKPSTNALTKYTDSICLAETHSSLHPLLIHHPDKHTFSDLTPMWTHPNEIALRTQIISELKFQMPSKAFFPQWSLNKGLPCPCISLHPVEAPLSVLDSQNARGQQMLHMAFWSMAELVMLPLLQACQDKVFPCTSPPHAAC